MTVEFEGEIWYWRGPAPFYFVVVPKKEAEQIKSVERMVTYGWGMIPVNARLGGTEWYTALWPKDGLYLVPVKASVRKAERLDEGDKVIVRLQIGEGDPGR